MRLDERAYDKRGTPQRHSRLSRFLPQTALVWKATGQLNAYASYVRGISLGQEAPFWTSNADTFLPSVQSRQLEVGVKYVPVEALTLGASVFRISQPYQYARPDNSDVGYTFVEEGTDPHRPGADRQRPADRRIADRGQCQRAAGACARHRHAGL